MTTHLQLINIIIIIIIIIIHIFSKNTQMSNLIKIRPVGAELFHVDRQTDMTQLIVFFS